MKKIYIYIFFFTCFISIKSSNAQNCWSQLGSGFNRIDNNYINTMIEYNGMLIAGGLFDSIGGIDAHSIAAWNGSSWSALGQGIDGNINPQTGTPLVYILAVYNGELYAAGQFDSAGGHLVNNIAKWDGMSWSPLGSGLPGSSYTVQALTVYNGYLYAGGRFDTAGGIVAHHIAKWDGTQWLSVDSGLGVEGQAGVNCLLNYNGKLYIAGGFYKPSNPAITNIAIWNDTAWSDVGNGINRFSGQVISMAFYQGILYTTILGYGFPYTDSIATWDGTIWSENIKVSPRSNIIGAISLITFNGSLLVGGGFDTIDGVAANNLAQWDGTAWSEFGEGVNGLFNQQRVDAFIIFNGHLYAGGNFNMAGADSANCIAEYTCATTGINEISRHKNNLYPNPTTGMINIDIDNIRPGTALYVYDLTGQKISQYLLNDSNSQIDMSGKPAGIYLYNISGNDGKKIGGGTFILQ